MIAVGDSLPDGRVAYFDGDDKLESVSVHSLAAGKKVVLFGVPGAFTPICRFYFYLLYYYYYYLDKYVFLNYCSFIFIFFIFIVIVIVMVCVVWSMFLDLLRRRRSLRLRVLMKFFWSVVFLLFNLFVYLWMFMLFLSPFLWLLLCLLCIVFSVWYLGRVSKLAVHIWVFFGMIFSCTCYNSIRFMQKSIRKMTQNFMRI